MTVVSLFFKDPVEMNRWCDICSEIKNQSSRFFGLAVVHSYTYSIFYTKRLNVFSYLSLFDKYTSLRMGKITHYKISKREDEKKQQYYIILHFCVHKFKLMYDKHIIINDFLLLAFRLINFWYEIFFRIITSLNMSLKYCYVASQDIFYLISYSQHKQM